MKSLTSKSVILIGILIALVYFFVQTSTNSQNAVTTDAAVTTLDTTVTALDATVTTLDTNVTTLDGKVTTLEGKVTTLEASSGGPVNQYQHHNTGDTVVVIPSGFTNYMYLGETAETALAASILFDLPAPSDTNAGRFELRNLPNSSNFDIQFRCPVGSNFVTNTVVLSRYIESSLFANPTFILHAINDTWFVQSGAGSWSDV